MEPFPKKILNLLDVLEDSGFLEDALCSDSETPAYLKALSERQDAEDELFSAVAEIYGQETVEKMENELGNFASFATGVAHFWALTASLQELENDPNRNS